MRSLLSAVVWRYLALVIQFGLVLLIAHQTSIEIAGAYFGLFGFVAVTFVLVGLGMSDGLVRLVPALRERGEFSLSRDALRRTVSFSVASTTGGAIVGCILAIVAGASAATSVLVAGWWLGYCLVFLLAQVYLALGMPSAGAFVAYSSINTGYLLVQVPYLMLAPVVSLRGVLGAAAVSVFVAVAAASVGLQAALPRLARADRQLPDGDSTTAASTLSLLRAGVPMMTSRLMQASIPWLPVWTLLVMDAPGAAAIYAAGSRLSVAVSSVVAALRFSVRPQIVTLNVRREYARIARLSQASSLVSGAPPLIAGALLFWRGDALLGSLFGEAYQSASGVVLVLMIGVLGEAFGGMADEILKMTGRTRVVLASLVTALAFELVLCLLIGSRWPEHLAWAVVTAFWTQYSIQSCWLSRYTPIKLLPAVRKMSSSLRHVSLRGLYECLR